MANQRDRNYQPGGHQGIRTRSQAERRHGNAGRIDYDMTGAGGMPPRRNAGAHRSTSAHSQGIRRSMARKGGNGGNLRFIRLIFIILLAVIVCAVLYGVIRMRGSNAGSGAVKETAADSSDTAETDEYGNTIRSEADIAADSTLSDDAKIVLGIKSSLESGNTVMETLRKYYPDDLILYKDKRYIFTPVNNELKKHNYKTENVRLLDTGEWQYTDGDKVISHKGIDISSHQGDVDWTKLGAFDIEFVMLRALYRGYSSGKLVEDEKFRDNLAGANANGIKAGVYVFTQALSNDEVDEEISMLKELIGQGKVDYPVVVDVEEANAGDGRMDTLDKEERTRLIKYYCEEIKKAGYKPMIYLNIDSALLMLNLAELEDYDKWFASYNADFYYPYQYTMWQYSDGGSIDGIDGNVDLDISFTDY